ncbi:hypothetical protein C8J57DRAFT_1490063 [Mycena rebaudengoi]|nr:hypothetical protein C8J57DRAFT_1490063 [Mycena rebaudengoi]
MPRRPPASESPSQSAARVTNSSSLVFAPPPLNARRPSWIATTAPTILPDASGRRPSWTPSFEGHKKRIVYNHPEDVERGSSGSDDTASSTSSSPHGHAESSEEASGSSSNLRVTMQIDMKTLVGDAVGMWVLRTMSISPTSRDVVLAARRGLFIIDLESPLSVPRFLPQGGTWDVADVQWNPHPSRAEYIVSTSSEKLLIWNLHLPSAALSSFSGGAPSSIQHVLHAHYRAITDINWHPAPAERDLVVSTGVDSWIWAWDLRAASGGRAVFGLSAFNSGGTQVKWNRQDPHILASSHAGEVLIWDRRNGSLPTTRLRAHRSKIYGIDWSPALRDEIVTCSLDRTIKVWDVGTEANGASLYSGGSTSPTFSSAGIGPTDAWSCAHCATGHEHGQRADMASGNGQETLREHAQRHMLKRTIRTAYPVWRARHLPFGRGVLSLAQRGETGLEMWGLGGAPAGGTAATPTAGGGGGSAVGEGGEGYGEEGQEEPVEVFEGHTDVVKEFVWRKGGDGTAFQLITWSKDRTLRFWPVDGETMQKVGYVRPSAPEFSLGSTPTATDATGLTASRPSISSTSTEVADTGLLSTPIVPKVSASQTTPPPPTFSFRNPPPLSLVDPGDAVQRPHVSPGPLLSAPIGVRAILAGVRSVAPNVRSRGASQNLGPGGGTGGSNTNANNNQQQQQQRDWEWEAGGRGGALLFGTQGPALGGGKAGGAGAGGGSMRMSRGTGAGRRMGIDALTWMTNVREVAGGSGEGASGRSNSGGRGGAGSSGGVSEVERSESVAGAGRKRSDSRVRVGEEGQSLQDELTSVINKLVSAKIKLEKHDLTKKRTCTLGLHGPWGESSSVFIRITFTFPKDYPNKVHPQGTPSVELERNTLISLKNRAFILRRLRAIRERQRPCLEACLRFLSEGEKSGARRPMDSESSSEGEGHISRKSRDLTVSLLRSHKNLAEPRTSQGTFGPNGELVCFFRDAPRIVRHVLRDTSVSASPAKTVSDIPASHDSIDTTGDHPPPRVFRSPALMADAVRQLSLAATDRIVKPLDSRRPQDGDHILRIMTNLLTFSHDSSHHRDSESSRPRGEEARAGHTSLPLRRKQMSTVYLVNTANIAGADRKVASGKNAEVAREHGRYDHERIFKILQALFPAVEDCVIAPNVLIVKMVTRVHSELGKMKDIQMLAMLSMLVLQGCRSAPRAKNKTPEMRGTLTPKQGATDYFSLARSTSASTTSRMSPVSPTWPRLNTSPPVAPLSTSNSSRGSWSSLFNAGSMRQFMTGVQDSIKDGLTTPSETPASAAAAIPVPKADRIHRGPDSPLPRRRGYWQNSGLPSPSTVSKSWNEPISPVRHTISFSSAGHRRPLISRFNTSQLAIQEARVVGYDMRGENESFFPPEQITQFREHVRIYADVLFGWQLYHKRLELLNSIQSLDAITDIRQHDIDLVRMCTYCRRVPVVVEHGKNTCPECLRRCGPPRCTICRLPVKGLSRSCLRCLHVTHTSCWNDLDLPICPSGCGCLCDNRGFTHGASFASVPPPSATMASSRASPKA